MLAKAPGENAGSRARRAHNENWFVHFFVHFREVPESPGSYILTKNPLAQSITPVSCSQPANGSSLVVDFVCESLCSSVHLRILVTKHCPMIDLSFKCGLHLVDGNRRDFRRLWVFRFPRTVSLLVR